MGKIMVTVELKKQMRLDLELPLDVEISQLLDDITQTIMAYWSNLYLLPEQMKLYDVRMKRYLAPEGTLDSERVWNGDVLRLTQR